MGIGKKYAPEELWDRKNLFINIYAAQRWNRATVLELHYYRFISMNYAVLFLVLNYTIRAIHLDND